MTSSCSSFIDSLSSHINIRSEEKSYTDFPSFVASHCMGYPLSQAQTLVERGKVFAYDTTQETTLLKKTRAAASFVWYLTFLAVTKGEGFKEGMFLFQDPGHEIEKRLKEIAYVRWSTHFPRRVFTSWGHHATYGIDIKQDYIHGLPCQMRTMIFSAVEMPDKDKREYTMLKIEPWGTRGLHGFAHTWGYLGTFLPPSTDIGIREELIPQTIKKQFFDIQKQLHLPHFFDRFDISSYGLAHIHKALLQLSQMDVPLQTEIRTLLNHLHTQYSDLDIRKGNEVIIKSL